MLPSPHHLLAFSTWTWLRRLGGPGLILLGLADNSLVPLPGSMDVLTIVLAAGHREWWLYYSGMATAGAVIGGYLTYRLARKGGKEMLERRLPKAKAEKVYRTFQRRGFWAITIPALLPPPVPIVPFLLTAGALQYSRNRFLAALTLGRGLRFTIVAFVAAHYGTAIFHFFSRYYKPALYFLIVLALVGAALGVMYLRNRRSRQRESAGTPSGRRKRRAA
jgi:membrane protein YqaA with SNARE-associated domain